MSYYLPCIRLIVYHVDCNSACVLEVLCVLRKIHVLWSSMALFVYFCSYYLQCVNSIMESVTNPSVRESNGVISLSQTNVPPVSNVLSTKQVDSLIAHRLSMPDRDWTFSRVANRLFPISTLEWTTAQSQGNTLAKLDIPSSLFAKDHMLLNLWKIIAYLQCGFRLHFFLNSTRFHQGALLGFFVPLRARKQSPTSVWSADGVHLYNATALPHVWLDASQAADQTISIPFQHIQTFLTMYGDFTNPSVYQSTCTLGTVYVDVLSQLAAATGASSSVSVQVLVEFINPHHHVPVFPHLLPAVPQVLEGAAASIGTRVASEMFNQLSGVVPEGLRPLANAALEAAPSLVACLDRPQDPADVGPLDNASSGDSVSKVNRLALGSASFSKTPAALNGADADELSISKLVRIPTIIREIEWNASSPVGTNLATIQVHPAYWLGSTPFDEGGKTYAYATPSNLAAVTAPFMYWKGSLTYYFRIVSTSFHSGRLRVAFCPNTNSPTSMAHSESLPNIIIDLREEKEAVFTVPFVSSTPWKLNPRYDGFADDLHDWNILGSIDIKVYSPLVITNNVSASVEIFVSVAGGDDFAVMTIGPNWTGPDGGNKIRVVHHANEAWEQAYPQVLQSEEGVYDKEVKDRVVVESLEAPGSLNQDSKEVAVGPSPNKLLSGGLRVEPGFGLFEGVHYVNLRDVLRRRYMLDILNFRSDKNYIAHIPVFPLIGHHRPTMWNGNPADDRIYPDPFSHVTHLFAMWRGSMRFMLTPFTSMLRAGQLFSKFIPLDFESGYITHEYGSGESAVDAVLLSGDYSFPYNIHRLRESENFGLELPFSTQYVSLPTSWYTDEALIDGSFVGLGRLEVHYFSAAETSEITVTNNVQNVFLEYSGGDDFLPFYYIGPAIFKHAIFNPTR